MPTCAVLILNYNGRKHLEEFLPSVVAHTPTWAEVIVADNGSTDTSVVYLSSHFPQVRTIVLAENYGFAQGYNKAIKAINHEYVLLLNSDVEVTAGYLEPLVAKLEKYPDIAAVQPKVLDYKRKTHFEYAGASGGFLDAFGYPFCRGRILDTVEADTGQYNTETSVFWASGAALLVRREVYVSLGGLCKDFFAHMEEIDLCWRIHRAGYDIQVVPQSTVYHLGGGTLLKTNPRKTMLNFRNSLAMILRNQKGGFKTFWLILARMSLDGVAGLQFLGKGEWRNTIAIIKAHGAFYSWLPRLLKERKQLALNLTQVANKEVHKPIFLIGAYFLQGKKKFSDL